MEHEMYYIDMMSNNVYEGDFIFHPEKKGRSAHIRMCIVVGFTDSGMPRVREIDHGYMDDVNGCRVLGWHLGGAITRLQRPERTVLIPDPTMYFSNFQIEEWEREAEL